MLTLAGRHVRLEPLTPAHVDALLAAATEPGTRFDWTMVPAARDAMATFVEWQLARRDEGTWVPFATVRRADEAVVGSTSFLDLQRWDRGPDLVATVEIGATWLAPSAQRSAVNTEAKLLMLTHAFEVWDAHRVQLKTDRRNEQSRAAIERLGARFEGILRNFQPGMGARAAGAPRDTAMFSITSEEWPEVRRRLTARLEPPASAPRDQ